MAETLYCFRCGESLEKLTPPLSQRDQCPSCAIHLHACRMCVNYDPAVPKKCREDDAEEVTDKEQLNFCEWFAPSSSAYDAARGQQSARARSRLAALFGETEATADEVDEHAKNAEDLFK